MRILRWALLGLVACAALAIGAGGSDSDQEQGASSSGGGISGQTLTIAFPSTGLDDLAIWPAIDALEKQGVKVERKEYAEQEDIVLALTKGDVDVAVNMATPTVVSGVEKGAPIKIISSYTKNSQILVARNGIEKPEDLNGKRIGVHSETSFTKALVEYYQKEHDVSGQVLIVAGSENRAQALGKDQLDASVISITDFATLESQYAGQFHVLEPFTEALPDLVAFSVVSADKWVDDNHDLAAAFVKALLDGYATVSDKATAMKYAKEHYSDFMPSQELLEKGVSLLVDGGYFPQDGLLTPESCKASVEFLVGVGQIEGLNTVQDDKYCRYDLVDAARGSTG
jgi:ABC-type nitrate/sulfonate/bicarbonate transport system substrate-binding protein